MHPGRLPAVAAARFVCVFWETLFDPDENPRSKLLLGNSLLGNYSFPSKFIAAYYFAATTLLLYYSATLLLYYPTALLLL